MQVRAFIGRVAGEDNLPVLEAPEVELELCAAAVDVDPAPLSDCVWPLQAERDSAKAIAVAPIRSFGRIKVSLRVVLLMSSPR